MSLNPLDANTISRMPTNKPRSTRGPARAALTLCAVACRFRARMNAELPLFLHLVGLALWTAGAVAALVLSRTLRKERDWRLRDALLGVARNFFVSAVWPGAFLACASGVWLTVSFRDWPPPTWLYVKIGVTGLAFVGTITAAICLGKARNSVGVSLASPSAIHEDRFDSMRRGFAAGGIILVLGLAAVVALSALRPNW